MDKKLLATLVKLLKDCADEWVDKNDRRYQRFIEKVLKAFDEEFGE